jgi:hypothetical protein
LNRNGNEWKALAAGVNPKEVDVVVVGVSGAVGAVCCLMSYTASVAIQARIHFVFHILKSRN